MTDPAQSEAPAERPISSPLPDDGRPMWQQVNDLFRKNGAPAPNTLLRDEIVTMWSWALYGQVLATRASSAVSEEMVRSYWKGLLKRPDGAAIVTFNELFCILTAALHLSPVRPEVSEPVWRTMDSAPKTSDDFTSGALDFIAWCPDKTARHGGDRRIVWWEPKLGQDKKGCWWCDGDFEVSPTHWMTLPAAPVRPAEAGETSK